MKRQKPPPSLTRTLTQHFIFSVISMNQCLFILLFLYSMGRTMKYGCYSRRCHASSTWMSSVRATLLYIDYFGPAHGPIRSTRPLELISMLEYDGHDRLDGDILCPRTVNMQRDKTQLRTRIHPRKTRGTSIHTVRKDDRAPLQCPWNGPSVSNNRPGTIHHSPSV